MPIQVAKTRHFELTQYLRSLVAKLPPGSSFPTMLELQASLGASQATVAKSLAELRADGLIYRPPNKKKYVVAERAGTPLLRFAMLRSSYPSIDYDALTNSILLAVREMGGSLSINYLEAMNSQSFRSLIDGSDGIAMLPSSKPLPGFMLEYLKAPEKPLVVLQHHIEGANAHFIVIDDRGTGRKAASYLASLGHRRIAILLDQPDSYPVRERLAGWREGMLAAGLEASPDLIVDCGVKPGENALEVSYSSLRGRFASGKPDFSAIFCVSMCGAIALTRLFAEKGLKIPGDVSVATFSGESEMAPFMIPKLSSLDFDIQGFGRMAMESLKAQLSGSAGDPGMLKIEPYLEIRDSTAEFKQMETAR